jgi:hypothetical protein
MPEEGGREVVRRMEKEREVVRRRIERKEGRGLFTGRRERDSDEVDGDE